MSDKNSLRFLLNKLGIDTSVAEDLKSFAESSDDSDSEDELEVVDIRVAMKDAEQTASKSLSRAFKKFDVVFHFFASSPIAQVSEALFKKRVEDSLIFLNAVARVTTKKPTNLKEKLSGLDLLCLCLTLLENSFLMYIAQDPANYVSKIGFDDPVTLAKLRQTFYQNSALYDEKAINRVKASTHFTKAMVALYEAKSLPLALEHLRNSLSIDPSPICQLIYDELKPETKSKKRTRNQRRRDQAKKQSNGVSQAGIQTALNAGANTAEEKKLAVTGTKNIAPPDRYTPQKLNQWMKAVFIPECKKPNIAVQEHLLKILDDLFPAFEDPNLFKKYLTGLLPLVHAHPTIDPLTVLYQLMMLAALFSLKSNAGLLDEKLDNPSGALLTALDTIIYDRVPYSEAWVEHFISITPEATTASLKQALTLFISVHKPDKSLGYSGAMAATLCSASAGKIESLPIAPVATVKTI